MDSESTKLSTVAAFWTQHSEWLPQAVLNLIKLVTRATASKK